MPQVELHKLVRDFVIINIPGKSTEVLNDAIISFSYSYNRKKRDSASITLLDEGRKISEGGLLYIDSTWLIRWGWEGYLLSPVVYCSLKKWETAFNQEIPTIVCELVTTRGKAQFTDELGVKREGRAWGKKSSSDIAKTLAKKHKLKYDIDESDDKGDEDFFQPVTMSDYAYLTFLANEIGFDFKITDRRLIYKARAKGTAVRHKFVYMPAGEETLVLNFSPEVNTVPKNTKASGSDTKKLNDKVVSAALPGNQAEGNALLLETITKNDVFLNQAQVYVDSQTQKVIQAQKKVDYLTRTTGLSALTKAAYEELFDGKHGLADALKTQTYFTDAATEFLTDAQNEAYQLNAKGANADAKDCKPKHGGGSETKPTPAVAPSVELGLADERYEKINPGSVESVLPVAGGSAEKRQKLACAKHREKVEKSVKATFECLGLPFIHERDDLLFVGFGTKFSGIWHVHECTHTFPGYTLTCELRRGPSKKKNSKNKKKANEASSTTAVEETEYVVELGLNDYRYEKITEQKKKK